MSSSIRMVVVVENARYVSTRDAVHITRFDGTPKIFCLEFSDLNNKLSLGCYRCKLKKDMYSLTLD